MQNFQRISSKRLYIELLCLNILGMFMFITRCCSDEEELGLVCWTEHILNVIEKAKDRAVLMQLLEAFLIR